MGKKKRNHDHSKKNIQTEEDVEDELGSWSVTNFSAVLVACMAMGFYLGTKGPNSNSQMSVADWIIAEIVQIPFGIHSIWQSMKRLFFSVDDGMYNVPFSYVDVNGRKVRDDASHPLAFAALREAVVREEGGFVHPDLGLMNPAPSGATRGIGMVRDSYHACQTRCMPGVSSEKKSIDETEKSDEFPPLWDVQVARLNSKQKIQSVLDEQQSIDEQYRQEEVLIKIPLSYQMTRSVALETLLPLIPADVLKRAPLQELDDAALLVLLLAHERGEGPKSKFHPYISTLPVSPSCGYSPVMRSQALQTIDLMGIELGMDVNGWPGELSKANDRAQMIADGLTKDYGAYISDLEGASTFSVMQWALCQVASRATAGSEAYGLLRLVPIADMVNHDVDAGGFMELSGLERLATNNIIDAKEHDRGAFIVRSIRHGRRRPLKLGQELLVNYNVPNYSPLDWFLSLGFVPPERMVKWQKVEAHFKKERTFSGSKKK